MMQFGWRPQSSCYQGSNADTLGRCPAPQAWFYVLLAIAAGAGLMARGKRGAGGGA